VAAAPDLHWRKSTFSGNNGACVEVAAVPDGRGSAAAEPTGHQP
jgi:hypothetical protein